MRRVRATNFKETIVDRSLRKTYWIVLAPAMAGFVLAAGALQSGWMAAGTAAWRPQIGIVLFVLAVAFAVALPILWRALFAYRQKGRQRVTASALLGLQRRLILTALAAPYLALLAYGLQVPRFYAAGSMLAALYAVYYHYPSRRKLRYEKRLFRVT